MIEYYSVLIVEDNPDIAQQLGDFLTSKGFNIDYAANISIATNLIGQYSYDVVVLDLMLPDGDGLSFCQYIKQTVNINTPVLMLTARDSLHEKISGFEVGADDYLTKPFALEEVFVRCLALTKRHQLHKSKAITIGDLTVNIGAHTVKRCGDTISLSTTGFSILSLLAQAYPSAVSKRHLIEKVWGNDEPESDAVRSHIYTLRNAIDKPYNFAMIKTIHGIGFKLVDKND